MEKEADNDKDTEWLNDLPIQAENIGFKPEEMIACKKCGRSNPPNRLNCFYCAADLEISPELSHLAKLNLRKLENWEKGFNIIHFPNADPSEPDIEAAARFLTLEKEVLLQILEVKKPLPLARIESQREAEFAVQTLGEHGLQCSVVSDEILETDRFPVRLRGIEFTENLILTSFNTGETTEISSEEILLIVTGEDFE